MNPQVQTELEQLIYRKEEERKHRPKCFPHTAREYWLLRDAVLRGDIILTPQGKEEMNWTFNELGDYELYRGMPDYESSGLKDAVEGFTKEEFCALEGVTQ